MRNCYLDVRKWNFVVTDKKKNVPLRYIKHRPSSLFCSVSPGHIFNWCKQIHHHVLVLKDKPLQFPVINDCCPIYQQKRNFGYNILLSLSAPSDPQFFIFSPPTFSNSTVAYTCTDHSFSQWWRCCHHSTLIDERPGVTSGSSSSQDIVDIPQPPNLPLDEKCIWPLASPQVSLVAYILLLQRVIPGSYFGVWFSRKEGRK